MLNLFIGQNTFADGGDPYCVSYGTNTDASYISGIVMGNIVGYTFPNNGNDNGYGDYTNISTWLDQGGTYELRLVPAWPYTMPNYWSVWIDFNQDYSFSADELVYSNSSPIDYYFDTNISIPANAMLGDTRMRIQKKASVNSPSGTATPCETFVYGEVEDYTVHIVPSGASCYTPYNLVTSIVNNGSNIDFRWNPVPNASKTGIGYQLAGRVLGSNTWKTINLTDGDGTYRFYTPTANTTYEWRVRARCVTGDYTDWSAIHYVSTTNGETCSVPSNLAEENLTPTGGLFTWDAVPEASYYQFAGRRIGGNWGTTTVTTNYSGPLGTHTAGESYNWSVRAYCEGIGYTAWASVRTFMSPLNKNASETLLQNNEQTFQFSVSPNPAQHIVNIQLEDVKNEADLHLQLFDASGRCVLQKELNTAENITLSVSELAEGIYFLAIQNEKYSAKQKLMIVR